jgi:hypothetical protein
MVKAEGKVHTWFTPEICYCSVKLATVPICVTVDICLIFLFSKLCVHHVVYAHHVVCVLPKMFVHHVYTICLVRSPCVYDLLGSFAMCIRFAWFVVSGMMARPLVGGCGSTSSQTRRWSTLFVLVSRVWRAFPLEEQTCMLGPLPFRSDDCRVQHAGFNMPCHKRSCVGVSVGVSYVMR